MHFSKAWFPMEVRLDGSESDASDAHEWNAPSRMDSTVVGMVTELRAPHPLNM